MSSEKTHYDDLNTNAITLAGFLSAIGVFVCMVGLQVLYYTYSDEEISRKASDEPAVVDSVIHKQEEELSTYSIVNQKEDKVSIPVKKAMPLVTEEIAKENKKETEEIKKAEEK